MFSQTFDNGSGGDEEQYDHNEHGTTIAPSSYSSIEHGVHKR